MEKTAETGPKIKRKKKKNRKLLLQIGGVTFIYSLMLVGIFCILMYVVGIYAYILAKQDQLSENMQRIYDELFMDEDTGVALTEDTLLYLESHAGELEQILNNLSAEDGTPDPKRAAFTAMYNEWLGSGQEHRRFFQEIHREYVPYAAERVYLNLFMVMAAEQEMFAHPHLMLLDVTSGSEGLILFANDGKDKVRINDYYLDPEGWISAMCSRGNVGGTWDALSEHRDMHEMVLKNSHEPVFEVEWGGPDAEETITGYYPIFVRGKLRCVLVVSYEWGQFQDTMLHSSARLSRVSLAAIMVSEALLLIFVYFAAVRPLRKVKRALQNYIRTKESAAVVKEMESVKQRNEFGVLADDISEMVQEIDRYTRENMELAGDREKAATELVLAAKIQSGMLRVDFPDRPEYEIYALMDPAKEVGGDFYDFFEVDSTHLALVIADVAGKGVPGSLFMMSALTVIRDKTLAGMSPAEILSKVNNELVKGDFGDMFVTVWLGILDLESGIITAANAGHEYPMIKCGDRFEMLKDKHGFVVGGMEGVRYQDYEINLKDGGTVFVYTDGVPEATNAGDELYGTDRVLEALNLYPDATPEEMAKNVKLDVDLFVGDAEQFDDLTILCIRYRRSGLRGTTAEQKE